LRIQREDHSSYLIVFVMPEKEENWLTQETEQLVLRLCAYWFSLEGSPATKATTSVRVKIPQANVFSVEAVHAMFQRLQKRKKP
jgi:Domain of unknown function (DUF4365)